jgi:hypothetical protein
MSGDTAEGDRGATNERGDREAVDAVAIKKTSTSETARLLRKGPQPLANGGL